MHATVAVGGISTIRRSRAELAQMMVSDHRSRPAVPKLVFSSNGQGLALMRSDRAFGAIMEEADIVHADGMPIVMASRLTRTPIHERCATTDFFHDAAIEAAANGLSFFFLGGSEDQNAAAVDRVRHLYPDLIVAGRHHGYFAPSADARICDEIVASGCDVLWVGLGKPLQEQWSVRNRDRLSGVSWVKTCGGLYSFLTGDQARAPKWMQSLGLEWLFRLMLNPKRLFRRYATTNVQAIMQILARTPWFEIGTARQVKES